MSYETWTRLAIGVLVFGAPVVFVWFLGEARELLGGFRREGGEDRSEGRGARNTTPPTG